MVDSCNRWFQESRIMGLFLPVAGPRNFLLFLVAGCWLSSRPVMAETCRYRFYPTYEPFLEEQITTPNSVCIFPDGRTTLQDGTAGSIELTIYQVQYLTDLGTWTGVNIPLQGLLLGAGASNLALCGSATPFMQVDSSEPRPVFVFLEPIFGGGHSAVDELGNPVSEACVYWAESECGDVGVEIYFNSPDINGDLMVSLSDNGMFTMDLYGSYSYRSDFNFDGVINLSDLGIFSGSYGISCP